MSRPASRFVMKLTKRQIDELEHLRNNGPTPRIRQRAHAILLSHERHSIGQIARIFGTNRVTIGQWLDRWDAEKFDGLADKPRPGAPSKLTETEQERLLELLKQTPHNPAAVLVRESSYPAAGARMLKRNAFARRPVFQPGIRAI